MKRLLFVVDAQNDFMPGGALAVKDGDKIVPRINELIRDPDTVAIAFSKDWHSPFHTSFAKNNGVEPFTMVGKEMKWPIHCVEGTEGAKIHKDISIPLDKLTIVQDFGLVDIYKGTNDKVEEYSAASRIEVKKYLYDIMKRILRAYGEAEIAIMGLCLDYCVGETALDLVKFVWRTVSVDLIGTKSVGEETGKKMIEKLKNNNIKII